MDELPKFKDDEKPYYKWSGKFTKIGKKTNPSYYMLVPKFLFADGKLKVDGTYMVQIEENSEGKENGDTTNEHTSI